MESYYTDSTHDRDPPPPPLLYLQEHLPSSDHANTPVLDAGHDDNIMCVDSGSFPVVLAVDSQQQQQQPNVSSAGNFDPAEHQQAMLSGGERSFPGWRDGRNEMIIVRQDSLRNLQGQGLSLSLATHIPSGGLFPSPQNPGFAASTESGSRNGDEQYRDVDFVSDGIFRTGAQQEFGRVNLPTDGTLSMPRTVPHPRYLRAAQQLLDEIVNVRKALKQPSNKEEASKGACESRSKGSKEGDEEPKDDEPRDSKKSSKSELPQAEREELQDKLTKLVSMVDEIDRRYKQYFYQMQIGVSSFDSIAGTGAAKPYTALALQTISRHFRTLRDAIAAQIQAARKSLGEEDAPGNGKGVRITRLRHVDQQIRQQRALKQLGMVQQHAWRPQRGLPESSVTILRAWLFENFLHPYPKDSDKITLARQTGLSRSQVSNWFINARVRLWKPMVEEIYKEETGDVEIDPNSLLENSARGGREGGKMRTSCDRTGVFQHTSAASDSYGPGQFTDSSYNQLHSAETGDNAGGTVYFGRNPGDADGCNLFQEAMLQSNGSNGRFMTMYSMSELARFGESGGVSLTLGLQHSDDGSRLQIPRIAGSNDYVTMKGGEGMYDPVASSLVAQAADFEAVVGMGNHHQGRFGSGHHLLHDFVA